MKRTDDAAFEELADTLWVERRLVEFLLFKLVTAKLLLAADERRFVGAAIGEVERAVTALREAEAGREASVRRLAARLKRAPDDLSLLALAGVVAQPLSTVLVDHHHAFHALADEIEQTARDNSQLASDALESIQRSLGQLGAGSAPPATYDPHGRANAPVAPAHLDQVL